MFEHFPRVHLSRRAYSVPNRSVQRRMASCETSIPRAGIVNLRPTAGTVAGCLTMWRAIDATGSRPR